METVATPFIADAECGPISGNPAQMPKWSKTPRTIFILSILFLASLVSALGQWTVINRHSCGRGSFLTNS